MRDTYSSTVTLNAWIDGDWEEVTFTGNVAILSGDTSTIEIQFPRDLLGDPALLYMAVISTDRARAHTAGDILGTPFVPDDWTTPVVLDTFFEVPSAE